MNYHIQNRQPLTPKKSISATVLGAIGCFMAAKAMIVAWIPLLGFAALPVAFVAFLLSFLGLICSMIKGGASIGLPTIGTFLSCVAIALPFSIFLI